MPFTRRRRTTNIVVAHEGSIAKYGYSLKKSRAARHRALKKAENEFTPGTIIRKLNALAVFNKKKHPSKTRTARSDMRYIQQSG
jgi:hypothetical protein